MDTEYQQLAKTSRNPVQESRFQELAKSQGSYGGGEPDYAKQRQIALEAVQPAVTSLEASVPEIRNRFTQAQTQVGNEKQPLKDRYDQLLNEIRGRETSQINDTTRVANREFARRGITADSTYAAEETLGRTAPIRSAAQSDILTTTFDREAKLRDIDNTISNLTTEMVTAERDVRNTIGKIQATAGTEAANRAVQMYQIQKQEQQAALDRALQERQVAAAETAAKKPAYTTLSEGASLVDANGKIVTTAPKTYAPKEGGGTDLAALQKIFGVSLAGQSTNNGPRYSIVP